MIAALKRLFHRWRAHVAEEELLHFQLLGEVGSAYLANTMIEIAYHRRMAQK